MKTVLKRALCGITAFVVAAGAMSYFPADTFPGIARGGFHGCAKLGEDGTATIPGADSAGEYVVMVCEFSDITGDITNDGVLNALDASAVLKCVIGISQGANPLMGDFNKDGAVNASQVDHKILMDIQQPECIL